MREDSRDGLLISARALAAAGVLAAALVASTPQQMMAAEKDMPAKPNIILIMADDLGYECIGANGGTSYKTPVLDSLAKTGIRFDHCYAQPLCTPSRAKIMTGIYNVRNYVRFGLLKRDQTTFAHLLKRAGYATCIAGKWQLGKEKDSPQHFGFDESCLWQHLRGRTDGEGHDSRYPNPRLEINGEPVDYNSGEYGPDVASDFICKFIEEHKDGPFLAYYPMILTHCPFDPPPGAPGWDAASHGSKSYKGDARNFGAMVNHMDKIVGRITQKLDELEIRDHTIILFTGDNGTDKPVVSECNGRQIAGGKGSMTDAGTHVPLIVNWPGTVPGDRASNDLVDFSDFLPTLCELAGVEVPSTLKIDGRSFLPQLKGEDGSPRKWIYCWYSPKGGPKGREWARNQRYKLYRTGKFYDLAADPLEEKPVDELSPEAQQARAMLQEVLDRYEKARQAELMVSPAKKKATGKRRGQ